MTTEPVSIFSFCTPLLWRLRIEIPSNFSHCLHFSLRQTDSTHLIVSRCFEWHAPRPTFSMRFITSPNRLFTADALLFHPSNTPQTLFETASNPSKPPHHLRSPPVFPHLTDLTHLTHLTFGPSIPQKLRPHKNLRPFAQKTSVKQCLLRLLRPLRPPKRRSPAFLSLPRKCSTLCCTL